MASYRYEAVDVGGLSSRGTLDVADQGEALRRIRQMGLFPTKVAQARTRAAAARRSPPRPRAGLSGFSITLGPARVKPRKLSVFTRQLATLVEAGMPLLRGLRTLQEQEENAVLKRVLDDLSESITNGQSLSEAMSLHPRIFNRLYINMVKAGELGGALEITLRRLAEFMEKALRIKGRVKSAMFYPIAVLTVATGIVILLMTYIVPRFKLVFDGLLGPGQMPGITLAILKVSDVIRAHLLAAAMASAAVFFAVMFLLRTSAGRYAMDGLKLKIPLLGPVFRKAAISRFSRTLGTLVNSGVPILQALEIVRETSANAVVGRVVARVRDDVKEGEAMAPALKESGVFPAIVAGMVDVGEQTGALPDMLIKVADIYDEDVDNAVNGLSALIEPIMIVFLAVVVGTVVIAMFWPLVVIINHGAEGSGTGTE
jgi:type IV pilus assembly protein PilC